MGNRWTSFSGTRYKVKDLGRPAVFLVPLKKLRRKMGSTTVEADLHRFLIKHFGAYTTSTVPNFGFWKDARRVTISDRCREYEVAFLGKARIPVLLKKLAEVAAAIEEECIYVKAGQYAGLVYPRKPSC